MSVKEFKINNILSLKLEDGKTNIYVDGNLFRQCRFLMLNIPSDEVEEYYEIESIDEAVEKLGWTEEGQLVGLKSMKYEISPDTKFMAHCSNLQVWAERNYDTCLLHSNLAFPLLRKLTQVGDIKARRVLKEEIIKRMKSQNPNVIKYLILEDYLKEFNIEEKKLLIEDSDINLLENLLQIGLDYETLIQILQKLENDTQITFRNKIKTIFEEKKYLCIEELVLSNYFAYMNEKSINFILNNQKINYFQILREILKQKPDLFNDIIDHISTLDNDEKIVNALRAKIKHSFLTKNNDAIIFILKFSLIETLYHYFEEKQVKINYYNQVSKGILDSVERELKDLSLYLPKGEARMANIGDRLYFIKNLKEDYL